MIPVDQLAELEVAAPTLIVVVALARVYFGSVILSPRYAGMWNTVRRVLVPLIEKVAYARLKTSPSLTNHAYEPESVGLVGLTPTRLATRLDHVRGVEIPLLAGYKTDWEDRKESGTMVWYYGPQPWPTAPNWLRPYQVHVTTFPDHSGEELRQHVTAHREANPYRPDKWADHLFTGGSHSDEDGVRRATNAIQEADIPLTSPNTGSE